MDKYFPVGSQPTSLGMTTLEGEPRSSVVDLSKLGLSTTTLHLPSAAKTLILTTAFFCKFVYNVTAFKNVQMIIDAV